MEKIAVWPDGSWCELGEVGAMLQWKSDDYAIIEVEFDDEGEPVLPPQYRGVNWK